LISKNSEKFLVKIEKNKFFSVQFSTLIKVGIG
jgi:hypothetical protein